MPRGGARDFACQSAIRHNVDPITLGDALAERYLAEGLPPDGGASRPFFRVVIGPLSFWLPNPPARKMAVFFHDANHILTGYNTVFSQGEMDIAGYEVASGCGRFWFAWLINLDMFALGLLARPRCIFRAFIRGSRADSLYRRVEQPARLAGVTVADLRRTIALDQRQHKPRISERARFTLWSAVAVATILAPVVAVAGAFTLARTRRR